MSYQYKCSLEKLEDLFITAADEGEDVAAQRYLVGLAICERLEALFTVAVELHTKIAIDIENRKKNR